MVLLHGDCRTLLAGLPTASVDAIVTDPPAGIGFMGKEWDSFDGHRPAVDPATARAAAYDCYGKGASPYGFSQRAAAVSAKGRAPFIACLTAIFTEARRVIKPGGHALVWALPRTSHWTATALEDAGWEIRDVIVHLTGQGFPKSLDVGKALDKAAGAERAVVGRRPIAYPDSPSGYTSVSANATARGGGIWGAVDGDAEHGRIVTAPATDLARQWDGWGTALKPAAEHWILARAPLSEPTIAANVAKHGTGALHIGATRIATHERSGPRTLKDSATPETWRFRGGSTGGGASHAAGRWPANVVLSHTLFCTPVGTRQVRGSHDTTGVWGGRDGVQVFGRDYRTRGADQRESGYTAPDGTETVEAWDCAPDCPVFLLDQQSGERRDGVAVRHRSGGNTFGGDTAKPPMSDMGYGGGGGASRFFYCAKASTAERSAGLPEGEGNGHPTVKPVALCRWLIRLVTPPGGVVCDPFMGSGSIGVAAREEGMEYIGMEQEASYLETARQRIGVPA